MAPTAARRAESCGTQLNIAAALKGHEKRERLSEGLASLRNDPVLQYHAVQRIIERLEQIDALPRESAVYQAALNNIAESFGKCRAQGTACSGGGMWSCQGRLPHAPGRG